MKWNNKKKSGGKQQGANCLFHKLIIGFLISEGKLTFRGFATEIILSTAVVNMLSPVGVTLLIHLPATTGR
jgi:hypothetical protein